MKKNFFLFISIVSIFLMLISFTFGNAFQKTKKQSAASEIKEPIGMGDFIENNNSMFVPSQYGVSSNPGAVNMIAGERAIANLFKMKKDSGVLLSALWIANGNAIWSGGDGGKIGTGNNLVIVDFHLDSEKLSLWQGGSFDAEFLQFNGMNTNFTAGAVQGFNSLPAGAPLNRSELYQLWYKQSLFNDFFMIRVGKMVPTYGFNNVSLSIPFKQEVDNIPSISGLLYIPLFVNSSMLGVLPGYYNSVYGVTVRVNPSKRFYLSSGVFDGNLAKGVQTGLTGPEFNGYYFYIGETGLTWDVGVENKPGKVAVGAWHQTGLLSVTDIAKQCGTSGIYTFGSQRLWYHHPGIDNSGISGFLQYGINNSKTLSMKQYFGIGLTAFALTRPKDSFGAGLALAWLNPNQFSRKNEAMFQIYYQAYLFSSAYLESAITYIPAPGLSENIQPTWAGTLQLIVFL